MPAAAAYGDGLVPLLKKKRSGLRALGIPDVVEERMIIVEALRHYSITVAEFDKANKAAHLGDSSSFKEHWLRGRQADYVADALFETFGLTICAAD